jgi:hypothetical protein
MGFGGCGYGGYGYGGGYGSGSTFVLISLSKGRDREVLLFDLITYISWIQGNNLNFSEFLEFILNILVKVVY